MSLFDDFRKTTRDAGAEYRRSSSYSTVGIQIAVAFLLFVFGGYKLDDAFGTSPLFVVIGALAAVTAMFVVLMRFLSPPQRSSQTDTPTPPK